MAMRTESSEERGKMGIFRAAFGYIAGMIIAILLIPITNMLGGTQSAWIKVAVIFGLISVLSLLLLYKVSKENVQIVEKVKMRMCNLQKALRFFSRTNTG